jgi:hypothetical protein
MTVRVKCWRGLHVNIVVGCVLGRQIHSEKKTFL